MGVKMGIKFGGKSLVKVIEVFVGKIVWLDDWRGNGFKVFVVIFV